jgi:nitrogen regulatory protein P-II 1
MLDSYKFSKNYYLIVVAVDSENAKAIINCAIEMGVAHVFIGKGRGVLHKNKIGPLTVPSISPLFDILNIIVPKESLYSVMNTLIKVGHLHRFGAGSIYASHIEEIWYRDTELFSSRGSPVETKMEFELQADLVAISCVCQLNHAEEIAHAAMLAGSASPTVRFGYGHGIRDRLGFFLQLTINPKKEFIELVVGSAEAERIFDIMSAAGHLDQPAQGFISTRPVEIGLINTISYQDTSPYPATMEQIIKAIDQLQGNPKWRSSGTTAHLRHTTKKTLVNLVGLGCVVNRGFGDACSLKAMEAGAGGTTTTYANAMPIAKHDKNRIDESDEREIISMTLGQDKVKAVIDAVSSMPELKGTPVVFYTYPVPEALTYLK